VASPHQLYSMLQPAYRSPECLQSRHYIRRNLHIHKIPAFDMLLRGPPSNTGAQCRRWQIRCLKRYRQSDASQAAAAAADGKGVAAAGLLQHTLYNPCNLRPVCHKCLLAFTVTSTNKYGGPAHIASARPDATPCMRLDMCAHPGNRTHIAASAAAD